MLKQLVALSCLVATLTWAETNTEKDIRELDSEFNALSQKPRTEQDRHMRGIAKGMAENAPMQVDRNTILTTVMWLPPARLLSLGYAVDLKGGVPLPDDQMQAVLERVNMAKTCTNPMMRPMMKYLGAEVQHLFQFPDKSLRVIASEDRCQRYLESVKK